MRNVVKLLSFTKHERQEVPITGRYSKMQTRKVTALGVAGLAALGAGWMAWQGTADAPNGQSPQQPMATATAGGTGLQAGARVPAFDVADITGQRKGKTLCYV
jgi:hypothetical protein